MGSKQSYGKGTVQNVVVLNKFVRNSSMGDFGALKTTTQKFYRVNGGSTQLEGVASDIVMPDRFAYIKIGERDSEHAMAWDKIPAATFSASVKTPAYQSLIENSKKRIALNPQFKLIDESAKWYGDRKEDNEVSLNFEKFEKEQKSFDEIVKKFKPISEYKTMLKFSSPPNDAELIKKDSTQAQKRQEWHDVMAKDVYLEEAVNVMGDMKNTVAAPKTIVIKKGKEKLIKS
jgi:carboxyl-terminal processing protease